MSVVNSILSNGEVALLAAGHGDVIQVLTGLSISKQFTARLDVVAPDPLETIAGSDPRMKTVVRFLPENSPQWNSGDLFSLGNVRYRVGKLVDDNKSSITIDYEVIQQA